MPPEEVQEVPQKTFRQEVWEVARILIISLIIVVPVRLFIAQPFIVRGASMEPNYHDGQYLIIDEISYRFNDPERGDVIVLRYPNDPSEFYIKRIIGLPGETVIVNEGVVSIQGTEGPLGEEYLPKGLLTSGNIVKTLEGGQYFVLGDNRENSSDSRVWGELDEDFVVGRAILRLWPIQDFELLLN
ncbi:MAG: signal peptidase I [bacterium]|nr:signal peptidase I [bacterium]